MNKIFNPKTVALVGATDRPGSVGLSLCQNLLVGDKLRKVFFVNPFREKIFKKKTYPSLGLIKNGIDLVIIAIPSSLILPVIQEAISKNVGSVMIISSGFAETSKEGKILQDKIKKLLDDANIPLLGPNCLGIVRPNINLNASFAFTTPPKGKIAFVSQSGALVGSIIDKSLIENYGFSTIISYGNGAGLALCDFLEWLKDDKETQAIGVYLEAIKDGRKFMKVAKEVMKVKPIVVLKSGKTKIGQKVAMSHTASLSSADVIYSAAFSQVGLIEVNNINELFNSLKALAWQPKCKNEIAIISNSGGCGVLLADYCHKYHVKLSNLDEKLFDTINNSKGMDRSLKKGNPIDIFGDALFNRYEITLNHVLSQDNVGAVVVVQTLQAMTQVEKNAKIIVRIKKKWPNKPIVTLFMGGKYMKTGIDILEKNHIPNYFDPEEAILAIKSLLNK